MNNDPILIGIKNVKNIAVLFKNSVIICLIKWTEIGLPHAHN